MNFDLRKYPPSVQAVYWDFPGFHMYMELVKIAVAAGVKDLDRLTDLAFHFHHPQRAGRALAKSEPNFQALAKQWGELRREIARFLGTHSRPTDTPEDRPWRPYAESNARHADFLSPAVKDWLAEHPKHERETALLRTSRFDGSRRMWAFAYKCTNPKRFCHPHEFIYGEFEEATFHFMLERKVSLAAIRADHGLKRTWISVLGNDTGAKMISVMNLAWNMIVAEKVLVKGMCLRNADIAARQLLHMEGKQIIDLVSRILGATGGLKPGSSKPPKLHEAPKAASELNWKGFAETLKGIYDGNPDRSDAPRLGRLTVIADRTIATGGEPVALIRHFD